MSAEEFNAMQGSADSPPKGGLGLQIQRDGDLLRIVDVIDGGPADRAGITPGSFLLEIDGTSLRGATPLFATDRMHGEADTTVHLKVMRPDSYQLAEVHLKREPINPPILPLPLGDGVLYLRVPAFVQGSGTQLAELLRQNAAQTSGLILDLRDNPGGVLDEAVSSASPFLPAGALVTKIVNGRRPSEPLRSFTAQAAPSLPESLRRTSIVVLTDRWSASGAEIVAGALKDHGRAWVIGERTQGHGSIQTIIPLYFGGAAKLTTAWYQRPSGQSIEGAGIEPDQVLASSYPRRIGDAASALRDPVIQAALQHLKERPASS